MAITKAMLARCQNELKQAFCALPEDVQNAMRYYLVCDVLTDKNTWLTCRNPSWSGSLVYRLSPDTPTEPEWEEKGVVNRKDGMRGIIDGSFNGGMLYITSCVSRADFLGIVYLKDGIETLRTSVDAEFGVPVRVRFSK